MSKRPALYLIAGGLTGQPSGIYRLHKRCTALPVAEAWPRDGEWRRLIHSLMRNPRGPAKGE